MTRVVGFTFEALQHCTLKGKTCALLVEPRSEKE